MKYTIVLLAFLMFSYSSFSQNEVSDLKPGDVLIISKDSNTPFQYLYFPKPNFIIKRGSIANYKGLNGMRVQIEAISDESVARLIPLNGKKFFNIFSYVNADLKSALNNKELKQLNSGQKS
ncbi:hypothetical protein SAMN04488008_102332 [Maribacter orientalis]|uniref:Uncharacterized protein n=1 Tax=Maribacter orientalis TaxID=228957 RepID=A0A1H7KJ34_9FLAO|nr:hypothetical protein [Maribacter orientalis]SEK86799.1 hypothetical protein SAMN04488008_102332 [Maribacter orientalis]|tara:strand:+ start:1721 stop:2083 length:363 start_codon:yes stop_codon:yes gene_type:complete